MTKYHQINDSLYRLWKLLNIYHTLKTSSPFLVTNNRDVWDSWECPSVVYVKKPIIPSQSHYIYQTVRERGALFQFTLEFS